MLSAYSAAMKYANWASGEPNNLGGEHCIVMHSDSTWNDVSCHNGAFSSVCEISIPSRCERWLRQIHCIVSRLIFVCPLSENHLFVINHRSTD